MNTAALDGALLVFHPGSGATVALTDTLLQVFLALQAGADPASLFNTEIDASTAGAERDAASPLADCLRLLRQQQLIQPVTP